MRIISGLYKGRSFKVPEGIRPTEDRVRKALFDILGTVEGESFLELFAGSGAVGLEAFSAGANSVVFVEKDREAVRCIQANLQGPKLQALVLNKDVFEAIPQFARNKQKFDTIFLDPPYNKQGISATEESGGSLAKKTLQMLGAYDILTACGYIIVQHFKKDLLPDSFAEMEMVKQSGYGDTLLTFYAHV
jgi:16S rRNA (guanine966-N2)-methyltransferase